MALEGTLHDFSLADILQLISLQKKTGILKLTGTDDTIAIGFSEGRLVTAESSAKRIDTRLGTLLVKTRTLSPDDLSRALEIQGQTLQRLGFILLKNGFCTADDLRAGLDTQIRKIVYGLFRWTDGDYVFDQMERIDYDHEFVTPVSVESLLMEGARMMDEWPIIEKVVRSPDMVFQRVPFGQSVVPAEDDDEVAEIGDSSVARRARERKDEPIKISRAEWSIYELVDGRRTVAEAIDRTFLAEFDGTKAFYDLVSRGLIEEARRTGIEISSMPSIEIPKPAAERSSLALVLGVVLGALAVVGVVAQSRNPLNVVTIPPRRLAEVEAYEKALSLLRMRRLSEAVDSYFHTQGRFPESTDALVSGQMLPTSQLVDPWGHRYRYILQADKGKYYLVGFDAEGRVDTDLFFSHSVQGPDEGGGTHRGGRKGVVIVN